MTRAYLSASIRALLYGTLVLLVWEVLTSVIYLVMTGHFWHASPWMRMFGWWPPLRHLQNFTPFDPDEVVKAIAVIMAPIFGAMPFALAGRLWFTRTGGIRRIITQQPLLYGETKWASSSDLRNSGFGLRKKQ